MSDVGQPAEERDRVVRDRIAKLEELRARGVEPYAYAYDPTHSAAAALASLPDGAEEGDEVSVAGRLVAKREMGKSTFVHLADRSGRIQLYFRLNDLGPEAFGLLDLVDLGDWLGARGRLFRTRTGDALRQRRIGAEEGHVV